MTMAQFVWLALVSLILWACFIVFSMAAKELWPYMRQILITSIRLIAKQLVAQRNDGPMEALDQSVERDEQSEPEWVDASEEELIIYAERAQAEWNCPRCNHRNETGLGSQNCGRCDLWVYVTSHTLDV